MGKLFKKEVNPFDEALADLFEERKKYEAGSQERTRIDAEICRLSEAKDKAQHERVAKPQNNWIGPVIGGVFGLAQIVLILNYEEAKCLTSKAINWVNKPKL